VVIKYIYVTIWWISMRLKKCKPLENHWADNWEMFLYTPTMRSAFNPSIEDGYNIFEQEENPTSSTALLIKYSCIAKTEPVTTTAWTKSL